LQEVPGAGLGGAAGWMVMKDSSAGMAGNAPDARTPGFSRAGIHGEKSITVAPAPR